MLHRRPYLSACATGNAGRVANDVHWLTTLAAGLAIVAGTAACAPLAATPAPVSEAPAESSSLVADVFGVTVRGDDGAYQFSVEIASPDTGCSQYADWWEVLDSDGNLLYRRILTHSHVDEQPFIRSGGPVTVAPDAELWVRAHLHPTGFGGRALRGTVAGAFVEAVPPPGFDADATDDLPRPDCAF